MIEILPGIFFDPEKEWYEQHPSLIQLALEVEKTMPVDYEMETLEVQSLTHHRLKWGVWRSSTELGTFEMKIDCVYIFNISERAFNARLDNNKVTITKVS